MTEKLQTHIMTPEHPSIGSVIWLHGLGADYHDFDTLVPAFWRGGQLPLRFIFPNAPVRPVSINQQALTRAWYDIYSLSDLSQEDEAGIAASHQSVSALIQQEIAAGVPPEKIVLAGFSQGGAMALHTGLRQQHSLGGVLALSCYLPRPNLIKAAAHPNNLDTPIFIGHGALDATLPLFAGKLSSDILQQTHHHVVWREYPRMGHEIIEPMITDIQQFLTQVYA